MAQTMNEGLAKRTVHYLKQENPAHVLHFKTLQKLIGFVALGLPFVLVGGEYLRDLLVPGSKDNPWVVIEPAISSYFHTGMRDVFVGCLVAIGIFLICYKGYERRDNWAANFAGFCILIVALFPTTERLPEDVLPRSLTLFSTASCKDPGIIGIIHFVAAALFFVMLAVMSIWLFTKGDTTNPRKRLRNKWHVGCGSVIIASLIFIFIGKKIAPGLFESFGFGFFTLFFETTAEGAFGVSWLIKAGVWFADKQPNSG